MTTSNHSPPFNTDNLRLRYGDSYSFLGRLCEEYDRRNGEQNWFPDPLTGTDHWIYSNDVVMVELMEPNPEIHEVEVYEARLGMFYLTPKVRLFHGLSIDQMEELFFLNTLAIHDGTEWQRMDDLMNRIRKAG